MTDLESLKARHPILEVARDLGLEVNHNRFRCPRAERHAHGDRTPSVTLWPERGFFKCWVCPEVKGDVIDLVRLMKGLDFSGAVAFLEKHSGYSPHPGSKTILPAGGAKQHSPHHNSETQTEFFPARKELKPSEKSAATPPPPREESETLKSRSELIEAFLKLCGPVHGKAAAWLKGRRIFQKTWEAQHLRMVENYGRVSDELRNRFSLADLQDSGLFNPGGHLRFYRHPLILPYFLNDKPVYLQARALDSAIQPKELSLAGTIPCPYNAKLLDGKPGPLYLCEGVIDALTLIEVGFAAVGVPGATHFKAAWLPLFRNKSVYVVFDADAAGEAGALRAVALLTEQGIEAHRLPLPAGKDINDWLRGNR